jgi:ActR/RegA family two-component response regulator
MERRGRAVFVTTLAGIREHVRRVYEMSDRNQRETARILRISRGKLSRHLRGLAPN